MATATAGFMKSAAEEIKALLVEAGVADQPVGLDIVELGSHPLLLFKALALVDRVVQFGKGVAEF